jgi:hypothetical protein
MLESKPNFYCAGFTLYGVRICLLGYWGSIQMDGSMRLKSWESPRSGRRRNDKSKQASARVRQLKKQTKLLRKRLKSSDDKGSAQTPGIIPGVLFCRLIFGTPACKTKRSLHQTSHFDKLAISKTLIGIKIVVGTR